MRCLLILLIAFVPALTASSKTLYVPGDYPTIQEAIIAGGDGDTVIVAPGTYYENIDFNEKSITVKSDRGPYRTIIDGGNPKNPEYGSVVSFFCGDRKLPVLDGFTLTNGTGTSHSGHLSGGGIYCYNNKFKSKPTIRNNIIAGNSAVLGGGIFCYDCSPIIMDNIISDNESGSGGGIYSLYNSGPLIKHNIIEGNTAAQDGGGIVCKVHDSGIVGSALVKDNVIAGNTASYNGGGIFCPSGPGDNYPIILNNLIYNNTSMNYGGGICCFSSSPTVNNNTIHGNQADSGGAIFCYSNYPDPIQVGNSILWDNNANRGMEAYLLYGFNGPSKLILKYSDVKGGKSSVDVEPGCILNWGPGMIDADPVFAEVDKWDYHLSFTSPCRDSGYNALKILAEEDMEGDPRIAYGTVDMGADEFYTHLYYMGEAVPEGMIDVRFVGYPGTMPVGLFVGSGIVDPPVPTIWGNWYLQLPFIGPVELGMIPPPSGILSIKGIIPKTPPPPYGIYLQALIGKELSNLCVIDVR